MSSKKYQYIGFALLVILMNYVVTNFASFNNTLSVGFSIVRPIFIGVIIAYFVYPLVMLLYNKIFYRVKLKNINKLGYYLSIIVSYVILFFLVYLLYSWLQPIAFESVVKITKIDYNAFFIDLNKTWSDLQEQYSIIRNVNLIDVAQQSSQKLTDFISSGSLTKYLSSIMGVTSSLYAYIMGVIVSVYMIISKDELFKTTDKFFYAILNVKHYELVKKYFLHFEKTFRQFFFGKMLDSFIIGIIAFVGMYLLKIPFYPLLAIIVMVTNMIPYFGPFIGGIPVVLVTLFVTQDPLHALWSALFILALQQFDGIYLGPKILGDSVGVSSVWIIIAIIIGGAMFKVVGLFLCVPVAATLKTIFNDFYEYRINKRKEEGISTLEL